MQRSIGQRHPGRREIAATVAATIGVSWLTFAAGILVLANEVAIPLDFVVRPIVVSLLPSIVIGLLSSALGRFRILAAICLSVLALLPDLWPVIAGLLAVELVIWAVQRRRRSARIPVGRFALVVIAVLLGTGVARLLPLVGDYVARESGDPSMGGPPIYLLLMDGYPRADSLSQLGIANSAFISELEAREFDHYPGAMSAHQWTHRTLQAMVVGSAEGIPDEPGTTAEERTVRSELQLPAGFLAIDPPASHVVMRGGHNASAGGMNDFEIRLLGSSAVGRLARDWAAVTVTDSLRSHFEGSLELMSAAGEDQVFAHVLAPHPPFMYADGLTECWPGCNVFDVRADKLEISVDEWADQMAIQLVTVNALVLEAVDRILARHPDAVIVLFSDHGGRYDVSLQEVHRSFIAARTPGRPGLLADDPHAHLVLDAVMDAYR